MARTRKKTLYLAVEVNYSEDPDTDGSSYLWVPCYELSDLVDNKKPAETNFFTGRDRSTPPYPGVDGGSFTFVTPWIGLVSACGTGTNASTVADDWLDLGLTHTTGNQDTTAGAAITATTQTTITAGAATRAVGDISPSYEAAYPASATQRSFWHLFTNATSPYNVEPGFPNSGPGTGGVLYGSKIYRVTDEGGMTLAAVYVEDDEEYTLTGVRIDLNQISWKAGDEYKVSWSARYDTKTSTTKQGQSLPIPGLGPAITAARAGYSTAYFDDVNLGDIESGSIDFAMTSAPLESTQGNANGRAGDELITARPTVTLNPLRTAAAFDAMRDADQGQLMIQLGRGELSSGVLNTGCVNFPNSGYREVAIQDVNGRMRNAIRFQADDRGSTYPYWQIARS